jgi:N-ethylmaleimide reductase
MGHTPLKNRIIMAPLTRLRSIEPGDIPTPLAIEYYSQRASAGLIITEATQISAQAKGYAGAPGLHTDEQQAAWEKIVQAVHDKGGKIAVQLWHTGLVSHQSIQPNQLAPISASAIDAQARTSLRDEAGNPIRVETTPTRAASLADIQQVIQDYADATKRAKAAGFDFIEIHGAHGYLLSQFWAEKINHRQDEYGGNKENRARLMLAVLDACIAAWDAEHIGIRLSPLGVFNNVDFGYNEAENLWLIEQISQRKTAFLHISEPDWAGGTAFNDDFRHAIRQAFKQTLIVAGAYDADKAEQRINSHLTDAVAFGRAFIANPDLVERIASDAPLNEMDAATAYGGNEKGYIDYPFMK